MATIRGDCPAQHRGLYHCTLDAGHDGLHKAHGTEPLIVWGRQNHAATDPTPTLRDQFAMAVVGGSEGVAQHRETGAEWATRIYARADALLAARSAPAPKKEG